MLFTPTETSTFIPDEERISTQKNETNAPNEKQQPVEVPNFVEELPEKTAVTFGPIVSAEVFPEIVDGTGRETHYLLAGKSVFTSFDGSRKGAMLFHPEENKQALRALLGATTDQLNNIAMKDSTVAYVYEDKTNEPSIRTPTSPSLDKIWNTDEERFSPESGIRIERRKVIYSEYHPWMVGLVHRRLNQKGRQEDVEYLKSKKATLSKEDFEELYHRVYLDIDSVNESWNDTDDKKRESGEQEYNLYQPEDSERGLGLTPEIEAKAVTKSGIKVSEFGENGVSLGKAFLQDASLDTKLHRFFKHGEFMTDDFLNVYRPYVMSENLVVMQDLRENGDGMVVLAKGSDEFNPTVSQWYYKDFIPHEDMGDDINLWLLRGVRGFKYAA